MDGDGKPGEKPSPADEPGTGQAKSPAGPCCCLATSLELRVPLGGESIAIGDGRYQSEIIVTFGLKRGDENKNACTFRWAEMTSRPIDMNIPENDVNVIPADARWHELSDNPGEKAKDARDHRKALESNPCLAGDVSFSDFPRAEPGRTLIARITLKSGCDGSSFTKYFVQVVTETGAHVTIMSTEEMLALSQAARAFLGLPR